MSPYLKSLTPGSGNSRPEAKPVAAAADTHRRVEDEDRSTDDFGGVLASFFPRAELLAAGEKAAGVHCDAQNGASFAASGFPGAERRQTVGDACAMDTPAGIMGLFNSEIGRRSALVAGVQLPIGGTVTPSTERAEQEGGGALTQAVTANVEVSPAPSNTDDPASKDVAAEPTENLDSSNFQLSVIADPEPIAADEPLAASFTTTRTINLTNTDSAKQPSAAEAIRDPSSAPDVRGKVDGTDDGATADAGDDSDGSEKSDDWPERSAKDPASTDAAKSFTSHQTSAHSPPSDSVNTSRRNVPDPGTSRQPEILSEAARENIRTVVEAARIVDRGAIEVTLTPKELGHVTMTVRTHDATGATVVLQADRPETLDLMRRHVDLLAQDLRDFGYRELTFTFQDRTPGQRHPPDFLPSPHPDWTGESSQADVQDAAPTTRPRALAGVGTLDLRL